MKEENIIVDKSYAFALKMMHVAKLIREQLKYDLTSHLWRVGAMNFGF